MNLCASVFVYVGSIVLYKRIINANTQSIRIANADGQVFFEDGGVLFSSHAFLLYDRF